MSEQKCKLSNKDLIKKSNDWVLKLCENHNNWILRVPVDLNNDPDMIFSEIADSFENILDKTKEIILSAAIDYNGTIISGFRHSDCYKVLKNLIGNLEDSNLPQREHQGFLTSKNRFVSREEAFKIAKERHQIIHYMFEDDEVGQLISEDLY